jgi:flagellar basal-body rod modification protein FlgD
MVTPTEFENAGLFAPPQQQSRTDLGQEDFLTLMITQFQNQDPFEPMDNGQFLGQLAQFSTVSGIESLNSSFSGLSGALLDEQALQASNLVGRTVLAVAETGYYSGSESMSGAVELGASVNNVQIDITDASGALVRRIDLGEQSAGIVNFAWDGLDAEGEPMSSGEYNISARASSGALTENIPVLIRADIESVTLGQFGGQMTLNTEGGGRMVLSQVYQII